MWYRQRISVLRTLLFRVSLPYVRVALEMVEHLQELHTDLHDCLLDAYEITIARRTTNRVPAQLVEEVDRQLAHVLVLVEKPEAERLQTVEVRWEPCKELVTRLSKNA